MAKNPSNTAVETVESTTPAQTGTNYTLKLHRADHPGNRSSYTIEGHAGNVVFFNTLFANGIPPATLTLDAQLVFPKPSNKEAAAAAKAEKQRLAAIKAQEKLDAQAAKAKEKADKAAAAIAKAQATIAAAAATQEAKAS